MIALLVGLTASYDLVPPSVPGGLNATSVVQDSFTLNWSASTDNVRVSLYEVFRDGVSVGTTTSTSLSVTGLSASTSYNMTVRARDGSNNWSDQSAPLSVTTAAATSGGGGGGGGSTGPWITFNPAGQTINMGDSFLMTVSGTTGSGQPLGTLEFLVANETTGGGYVSWWSQPIASNFYGNNNGGNDQNFTLPSYKPATPGNYTFQARLTVSGNTVVAYTFVGGFVAQ